MSPIKCGIIPKDKNADVIVISSEMSRALHRQLTFTIKDHKRYQDCILFLTTYGGDPDGAYRVARCLRHHYEHLRIVVPTLCKSAGTLLAIAANELAIGDAGELGPLDIQVDKPNELSELSSCLDIQQALASSVDHAMNAFRRCLFDVKVGGHLSAALAGEFAHRFATGLFSPLMAQIDPQRIGEMARAISIATYYGERLDAYAGNLNRDYANPINDALNRLVSGYPSHRFVIDRKEAKQLFKTVSQPEAWEYAFFEQNLDLLLDQGNNEIAYYCPENVAKGNCNVDERKIEPSDSPENASLDRACGTRVSDQSVDQESNSCQ